MNDQFSTTNIRVTQLVQVKFYIKELNFKNDTLQSQFISQKQIKTYKRKFFSKKKTYKRDFPSERMNKK